MMPRDQGLAVRTSDPLSWRARSLDDSEVLAVVAAAAETGDAGLHDVAAATADFAVSGDGALAVAGGASHVDDGCVEDD